MLCSCACACDGVGLWRSQDNLKCHSSGTIRLFEPGSLFCLWTHLESQAEWPGRSGWSTCLSLLRQLLSYKCTSNSRVWLKNIHLFCARVGAGMRIWALQERWFFFFVFNVSSEARTQVLILVRQAFIDQAISSSPTQKYPKWWKFPAIPLPQDWIQYTFTACVAGDMETEAIPRKAQCYVRLLLVRTQARTLLVTMFFLHMFN